MPSLISLTALNLDFGDLHCSPLPDFFSPAAFLFLLNFLIPDLFICVLIISLIYIFVFLGSFQAASSPAKNISFSFYMQTQPHTSCILRHLFYFSHSSLPHICWCLPLHHGLFFIKWCFGFVVECMYMLFWYEQIYHLLRTVFAVDLSPFSCLHCHCLGLGLTTAVTSHLVSMSQLSFPAVLHFTLFSEMFFRSSALLFLNKTK